MLKRRQNVDQLRTTQTQQLDGQALAALGAAGVDYGTATACFHANQKTVGAGTANLGGLVSAFHFGNPKGLNDGSPE
jgi:hypothetical protein